MRFVHADPHTTAEVTAFTDKSGWEHVLVVMKATFSIPEDGGIPKPLPPQPLAMKDDFDGKPGLSAPLYENDFASRKAMCDVVFRAHAHAPHGKPVKSLDVAVQVGKMVKAIHVVGNRHWEKNLLLIRHSEPERFVAMPLHFGRAFGGCAPYEEDGEMRQEGYPPNPVGTGFSKRKEYPVVHGMRLPNLEVPGKSLSRPDEPYPAIALSPTARNFYPRYTYAGTYDERWKNEIAPFLPDDFDERYFQCAPEDQQIPYPIGGEEVCLINVMPNRPGVRFRLPKLDSMPVRIMFRTGEIQEHSANADTLFIDTTAGLFSVVWRASTRLPKDGMHGVHVVTADTICPAWWESIQCWRSGCMGCPELKEGKPPKGCVDSPDYPAMACELAAMFGERP